MPAITISNIAIQGWNGSANVQLQIITNQSFTASSGNIYPQTMLSNPSSLGRFYQTYTCNVSGTTLTIPAITIDSTVDSTDNPSATFSAWFFDVNSGQNIQPFGTQTQFSLATSPTSTSWANIFASAADY